MAVRAGVFTVCLLFSGTALAAVPTIESPITDLTGVIGAGSKATITQKMRAHRDATGTQIAVLLVPTTDGIPVGDYALQVMEQWRGGQKGKDNGILVLYAVNDHKYSIKLGYGIESMISDAQSKQIMDSSRSYLRSSDYGTAVDNVVTQLIAKTRAPVAGDIGSGQVRQVPQLSDQKDSAEEALPIIILLGIGIATVIGVWLVAAARRKSRERFEAMLEENKRNLRAAKSSWNPTPARPSTVPSPVADVLPTRPAVPFRGVVVIPSPVYAPPTHSPSRHARRGREEQQREEERVARGRRNDDQRRRDQEDEDASRAAYAVSSWSSPSPSYSDDSSSRSRSDDSPSSSPSIDTDTGGGWSGGGGDTGGGGSDGGW